MDLGSIGWLVFVCGGVGTVATVVCRLCIERIKAKARTDIVRFALSGTKPKERPSILEALPDVLADNKHPSREVQRRANNGPIDA